MTDSSSFIFALTTSSVSYRYLIPSVILSILPSKYFMPTRMQTKVHPRICKSTVQVMKIWISFRISDFYLRVSTGFQFEGFSCKIFHHWLRNYTFFCYTFCYFLIARYFKSQKHFMLSKKRISGLIHTKMFITKPWLQQLATAK